jgi:hypothetical protein
MMDLFYPREFQWPEECHQRQMATHGERNVTQFAPQLFETSFADCNAKNQKSTPLQIRGIRGGQGIGVMVAKI